MLSHAVRILVVGLVGLRLGHLLDRLAQQGWEAYRVSSNTEARIVLRTLQFDLVLAAENLCDGTGYDLAQESGQRSASLFVEVGMSEGHVWLPVVERGTRTMGEGALDLADLEWEARRVLSGASLGDPFGNATHPDATGATRASGPALGSAGYGGANRAVLAEGAGTTRNSSDKAST